MQVKTPVVVLALVFATVLFAKGEDMSSSGDFIKINILAITTTKSSTNTVVKLALQLGGGDECLKISRFSLATAIRNCMFYDSEGNVWALTPQGKDLIIDPPAFNVDYKTELHRGRQTVVELSYDSILPLKTINKGGHPGLEIKCPSALDYQLFDEISVAPCNAMTPKAVESGGRGNAPLSIN